MDETETQERVPTRDLLPGEQPDVDAIMETPSDLDATIPSVTLAAPIDATPRRRVTFGDIVKYAKSGHPTCNGGGVTYEPNPADRDKPIKKLCRCAAVRFAKAHPEITYDRAGTGWWPSETEEAAAKRLVEASLPDEPEAKPPERAMPDRERRLKHIVDLERRRDELAAAVNNVEHEIVALIKDDVGKKVELETEYETGVGREIMAAEQAMADSQTGIENLELKIQEFTASKAELAQEIVEQMAKLPDLRAQAAPTIQAIRAIEETIKEKVGRTRKHQNRMRAKVDALEAQIGRLKLRNA
jgi:hypothetical protein